MTKYDIYNVYFDTNTITTIADALDDLEKWSAYHNDKYLNEIAEMKEIIKKMKQQELYGL